MKENEETIEHLTKEDLEKIKEINEESEDLTDEEQKQEEEKENQKKDKDKDKKKQKNKTVKKKETVKEKNKDKKDKDKKKDKRDKKNSTRPINVTNVNQKRTPILLWILIIILVSIGVAAGVFYYVENEKDVDFDNEWEEKYYEFLANGIIKKGKDENGKTIKGSTVYMEKNPQMFMLEIPNMDNPVMITQSTGFKTKYQTNSNKNIDKLLTVHSIDYNGNVDYKILNMEDLVFLYNIEQEEYGWYLYTREGNEDVYKTLEGVLISSNVQYRYKTEEDFEKNFIKVNVSIDKQRLGDNISENRLKNIVKKASEKMKYQDDLVTDKIMEDVEKKLDELNKVEEDEDKEVEVPEQKEEKVEGLTAGDYVLAYGKYVNGSTEITLNKDYSCKYKKDNNEASCKYKLESSSNGYQIVVTVDGEDSPFTYNVKENNKFDSFSFQE